MNILKNFALFSCRTGSIIFLTMFLLVPSHAQEKYKFTIWISAFIPGNVSVGRKIPNGNGTMISIKYVDRIIGCFDTDQRGFSSRYSASVRVRGVVTATSKLGSERLFGICGVTKKRNCKSGKLISTGRCNANKSVRSSYRKISQHIHEYTFDIRAGNPLVVLSRWGGPIRIKATIQERWSRGVVSFSLKGRVGDFPAFEGYVGLNRQIKRLFAIGPKHGAGPQSLAKGLTRAISGRAVFSVR